MWLLQSSDLMIGFASLYSAGCRGLYGNAAGELALHHFQNPSSRIKQFLFIYLFTLKPSKFIPTIVEGPNLSSVQMQYKSFLWLH